MPAPLALVSLSRAAPWRSVEQTVHIEPVRRVYPLYLGIRPGGELFVPAPHFLGAIRPPGVNQKVGDPQTAQQIEAARPGKEMNALEQDLMARRGIATVAVGDRFPVHGRGVEVLVFPDVLMNGELD